MALMSQLTATLTDFLGNASFLQGMFGLAYFQLLPKISQEILTFGKSKGLLPFKRKAKHFSKVLLPFKSPFTLKIRNPKHLRKVEWREILKGNNSDRIWGFFMRKKFLHMDPPLQITNGTRREKRSNGHGFRYALTCWKKFMKAARIKMEQAAITLLNNVDLNVDDYTIRIRIVRLWTRPTFNNRRKIYCYDMIFMDQEVFFRPIHTFV
ncbi:hypothetical protein HanXRQr2_Chr15g0702961 [Helianthus annuus]|uniref:Uncharacterized protein n=1 Tax=Helianthus annuus TaxID=4232 RepID=A0A9K3E3I2_HELAN|nr:hypothetical protein HanXRQr2_Chr15g0702961 [Helianthus annuus]KAJ0832061.1 hypothetical protein HanPSC8_Chr15g0674421 [Helianthus annuus]